LQQEVTLDGLLTPVFNNNTGAADDLARVSLSVENAYTLLDMRDKPISEDAVLTQTSPLAQLLGVRNFDQRDLGLRLSAKSLNELNV
jgi:hypothetical protein